MPGNEFPPFRKGQYEMQEQSRLQQPGNFIGPQHGPIETVELADIMQRVEDERDQAENVKMRGTDGRPTPHQHVESNAQVDEGDQPQPIVHGPLGGYQDHFHIQRNRAADQRVGRLRPYSGVIEPVRNRRRRVHPAAVDADNLVPAPDSSALRWPTGLQSIRRQMAVPLHPPGAIVWNCVLMIDFVVETSEQYRSYCEKSQQYGGKTSLKFA